MENPTMTHDEIKAALIPKYRTAQAVCERVHGEAWYALTEERDADRYEFLMRTMRSVTHYLEGIQGAAEAKPPRQTERMMQHEPQTPRLGRGLWSNFRSSLHRHNDGRMRPGHQ